MLMQSTCSLGYVAFFKNPTLINPPVSEESVSLCQ